MLISALYSVEMSLSSKLMNRLKPSTSLYQSAQSSIFPSSTLPTMWSMRRMPASVAGHGALDVAGQERAVVVVEEMNEWSVSP